MKKVLNWLDNNILAVLAGFLLVFIPLYPKWPLFDILYGYNVRVRLEDFFVAATLGIFLFQLIRRRISIKKSPVIMGLLLYLLMGFLSMLVAFFVIHSVPLVVMHMGKTFLHWLRRVEYFSLFFFFFYSVRSWKVIRIYLILFFLTLLAVIVYGYGQKYFYWPAFSTMNREFAKGWWLYLTEHARVLSTFGGHYDLAAYLVIALTLSWSFFFGLSNKLFKLIFALLIANGFWLLILTASRSSFLGYLIGLSIVVLLWTFKKGLGWGISRLAVTVFLSIFIMLSFGDLSDRFLHILRISERVAVLQQVLLKPAGAPPKNQAVFLENNLSAVALKSDVPPSTVRPSDVTAQQDYWPVTGTTASGASTVTVGPRKYSQNALMFDLSTGIRLDATWPSAIKGFLADPILGSGYATLNKTSLYDFTDAESTDNDFLRSLGETGLLGFITFFGTLALMIFITFRSLGGITNPALYALSAGFVGLTVGLLANALLVDLFEASKVAYVYWSMAGLTMGSLYFFRAKITDSMKPLRITFDWREGLTRFKKFLVSDLFWVSLIAILVIGLRSYKLDSPVADWHSWRQADTSAVTRDFIKNQQVNFLYPTYEDISSIASGKENPAGLRLVEFPIYNAVATFIHGLMPEFTVEESGRITTILASVLSMIFLFLICRRVLSRKIAYFSAIAFAVIPYNIFYGRVILPDPSMVAMAMGAIWFASEYLDKGKKRFLILTGVFAALAMLLKPYAVFLLATIGYLMALNFKTNYKRVVAICVAGALSMIPFLLWRGWISHHPEAIPASDWLFNGNGIRFKGAFWYWLFADRIGRLILGFWGLILLGAGLIRPLTGRYKWFPVVLFGASVLYLIVFATGNVQHDYYQIVLMPSIAVLVGLGFDYLISFNLRGKILAIVAFLFMVAFGWYFVKDYYNINHPEIVTAGERFVELTQEHEKALVIAPYDGDTAFLYQLKRKGWPIMEKSIDDMIKMGADYYASVRFDDLTNKLLKDSETKEERLKYPLRPPKKYTLLDKTDQYAIIQLVPDKDLPGN